MKFAIDLLWVKPQKTGGIESYIRNLLLGFKEVDIDFQAVLMVSEDNEYSFAEYRKNKKFMVFKCPIKSENPWKRILWQNLHLNRILQKLKIKVCFEPVYSKPIINIQNIKYITTIHDLQALHYPQYHSVLKRMWLKFCWWNTIKSSYKIVAISEFVRRDIINKYHCSHDKTIKIYNPIFLDKDKIVPFKLLKRKYEIREKEYFYTVSSLLPHKNLLTIIKAMGKLKQKRKLVISGIKLNKEKEIKELIRMENLDKLVVITGFISDEERNALYANCKAFLFSSLFEGFGMPAVEAMIFNCEVITSKNTSIYEVTQGKAYYIKNPRNVLEWVQMIEEKKTRRTGFDFGKYSHINVAKQYLQQIEMLLNK